MQGLGEAAFEKLSANLSRVRERMTEAALRAGRRPDSVALVAVTKNRPARVIPPLLELGVEAIGENRADELLKKARSLDAQVPWHLIGHYQRNKISKTLPLLRRLHSADTLRLLSTLEVKALALDRRDTPLPLLLQVNVSGESTKQGFSPEDVEDVLDLADAMSTIEVRGFMTMAPAGASPDRLHEIFGRLRGLRDRLGEERLPELSMGMSGDFEIAIEEGATWVRIGRALFDGVDVGA
ncbi:MAG TPA: YggS family pyridoxal phosphate-dependent enzyme [Planctomycetes bacterium]|nr:YggS family pyridoxal phosphate-dependent enzyme [Planctomycetota bacterium]